MIALGIVLLLVGWLIGLSILETLGLILLVIGVVLVLLSGVGYPLAGRRHWY